jgi:phage terminase large subunit GpA-like protein
MSFSPLQASDFNLDLQSCLYLSSMVDKWTDWIDRKTPVEYVQGARYLPASVSPSFPGFINFDLTPFWIEPLNNFDPDSPVRETIILKGVQVAYTTTLENVIFYIVCHLKTVPFMFVTADLGLSGVRMENNILPMFQHSGMNKVFVSSDETSTRKRGVKKTSLQWEGGGYGLPFGAQNANKARQQPVLHVLMDEIDGWPLKTRDGSDMVGLFTDRASAGWDRRKIFIGSTPNDDTSRIWIAYQRGDQRKYNIRCLKCGFPQEMRMNGHNQDTGEVACFRWDYHSNGALDIESVRYHCINCLEPHEEHHKTKLFSVDNAEWVPTATPVEPGIRSYHVPAFLSPPGMQPWHKCISTWLDAWDVKNNRMKDSGKLQRFYNNILGKPWFAPGARTTYEMASAHRRMFYKKGEIPNSKIVEYCDSKILLLTCTVDVHKAFLAVAIWGWTANMTCWLIDYFRIVDNSEQGCESRESSAWRTLESIIYRGNDGYDGPWIADDGTKYKIAATFIDSGYGPSTVCEFCQSFESNVWPIVGRDRAAKFQQIQEFAPFKTKAQGIGYRILVDFYKERIAPVLRREWLPEEGKQRPYTFNAPVDITEKELKELTAEQRRPVNYSNGKTGYEWYRPQGSANELWDLMVYGHAGVEILAWKICIEIYKMDTVDWPQFWEFLKGGYFFEK